MSKHLTLSGLQTVLPPIKHLIDKKAESWDDLKEKPFGSEIKEVKLIDNISITLTDLYEDGIPGAVLPSFGLNEGSIYSVIYDGLTYECKCFAFYEEALFIGNPGLIGEASATNEPFLIIDGEYPEMVGENLNTTHTLSIAEQVETIKKIPEKYLDMPEGILTTSNYLETTAGMQQGVGEIFNNYDANIASGYMAHAEGSGTRATGLYSHAEGFNTKASSRYSHTEGYKSEAEGEASHAEGKQSCASGMGSHAEGANTFATNYYSHAEGHSTEATNESAHAEGSGSIASGLASHAEGGFTAASGERSHAEGSSTIASGFTAHAEGSYTQAKGAYSHAQGYSTTAVNAKVFVTGRYNLTPSDDYLYTLREQNNQGVALTTSCYKIIDEVNFNEQTGLFNFTLEQEETTVENLVIGDKFVASYDTDKKNIYYEVINITDSSSTCKCYDVISPSNREGKYAQVVGNGTSTTSASNAYALDWDGNAYFGGEVFVGTTRDNEGTKLAKASDIPNNNNLQNGTTNYSLRSISSAKESSDYTIGEGAIALGSGTKSIGDRSFSMGYECIAQGNNSYAAGGVTKAIGPASHAEGAGTNAIGEETHAEGYYTIAKGQSSHAEGYFSHAIGLASHAENYGMAYGTGAHVENGELNSGIQFILSGEANTLEYNIDISNPKNYIGYMIKYQSGHDFVFARIEETAKNTIILSKTLSSTALTNVTVDVYPGASGDSSHCEGLRTLSAGESSHAEGYYAIARGNNSHAEGYFTLAESAHQHVQGKYNIADESDKYAHIVGNGTNNYDSARSNAHTLDWSGNAWYQGDVYVGGTGQDDAAAKKLATEEFVAAPKSSFTLIDEVTGENYVVCIRNGSLVTYKAE